MSGLQRHGLQDQQIERALYQVRRLAHTVAILPMPKSSTMIPKLSTIYERREFPVASCQLPVFSFQSWCGTMAARHVLRARCYVLRATCGGTCRVLMKIAISWSTG